MTEVSTHDVLTWPAHDGLPHRATAAHLVDDNKQPLEAIGLSPVGAVAELRLVIAARQKVDPHSFLLTGVTRFDERVCKRERAQLQEIGL